MSQTSSDVESCVEALTFHPRGLLLLLCNFRSLKYLTTAQTNATMAFQMPVLHAKRFVSPDHRGWNRSHTFENGGFTFCDEVRLCLQVLSCC